MAEHMQVSAKIRKTRDLMNLAGWVNAVKGVPGIYIRSKTSCKRRPTDWIVDVGSVLDLLRTHCSDKDLIDSVEKDYRLVNHPTTENVPPCVHSVPAKVK